MKICLAALLIIINVSAVRSQVTDSIAVLQKQVAKNTPGHNMYGDLLKDDPAYNPRYPWFLVSGRVVIANVAIYGWLFRTLRRTRLSQQKAFTTQIRAMLDSQIREVINDQFSANISNTIAEGPFVKESIRSQIDSATSSQGFKDRIELTVTIA